MDFCNSHQRGITLLRLTILSLLCQQLHGHILHSVESNFVNVADTAMNVIDGTGHDNNVIMGDDDNNVTAPTGDENRNDNGDGIDDNSSDVSTANSQDSGFIDGLKANDSLSSKDGLTLDGNFTQHSVYDEKADDVSDKNDATTGDEKEQESGGVESSVETKNMDLEESYQIGEGNNRKGVDEQYDYYRHHYRPRDYYFLDEFYGIDDDDDEEEEEDDNNDYNSDAEKDDDILTKESIKEMIQKLSSFLDEHNPCDLNLFNKTYVNVVAGEDDKNNHASSDDNVNDETNDARIMKTLGDVAKELDVLFNINPTCNETTKILDTGNNANKISRENSSASIHHNSNKIPINSSVSNHNTISNINNSNVVTRGNSNNTTAAVSPPSFPPHTVTAHVVHYNPFCWHLVHQNPHPHSNSHGDANLQGMGFNCEKHCQNKNTGSGDNGGNVDDGVNAKNGNKNNKGRDDGDRTHPVADTGMGWSEEHKIWEGNDTPSNCHKQQGTQRPCIDMLSQESVLSQLCTRMNAVEDGNRCMTSQLSANQKTTNDIIFRMDEEVKELKKTIERLQKSCMFYAEAPLGSSQVRGYKVKLSQGEGFEPASGVFTAPYEGVYQVTVGYFKRTQSNTDEVINIMTGSSAIFRFRVEGIDQQRIFMTSLESGQSLWLKTNVKLSNEVNDVNIDLIFFGAFLMK